MNDVERILTTEFSEPFVQGMKDRMVVSFYKYGPIAEGFPYRVNAITSLTDRLRKYAETGNTEFLMDAANFAMIEFMHPAHPNAFFEGTDSDASPGRRSARRGVVDHRSNAEIGSKPVSQLARWRDGDFHELPSTPEQLRRYKEEINGHPDGQMSELADDRPCDTEAPHAGQR